MSAKHLVMLLITLAIAFAGIVVFYIGWNELNEGLASSSWPTTDGVIEASTVETESKKDRDGNRTTFYTPNVQYRYQVNGATLYSNRVGASIVSSSLRADAQAVIARYPAGKTVKVYYSPSDPSRALLEPGLGVNLVIIPGLGACFALLGVGGFLGALRMLFTQRVG